MWICHRDIVDLKTTHGSQATIQAAPEGAHVTIRAAAPAFVRQVDPGFRLRLPPGMLAGPLRVASNPVGRQPTPALFERPKGHHTMVPANARSIAEQADRTNPIRIRNAP